MAKTEIDYDAIEDIVVDEAALAGAEVAVELNDGDIAQVAILKETMLVDKNSRLNYRIAMFPMTTQGDLKSVARALQMGEMLPVVKAKDLMASAPKADKVVAQQALDKWYRVFHALEYVHVEVTKDEATGEKVKTKLPCPPVGVWDKDLKSFVINGEAVEREVADSAKAKARSWTFKAASAVVNHKLALQREDEDNTDGLLHEYSTWVEVSISEKDGQTFTNAGQYFVARPKKGNFFTE